MSKGKEKFDKVMHEWGQGKLRSSSGHKVKYPSDRPQALAIAYSEARSVEPSFGNGGKLKTEKMAAGGRVLAKTGNPLKNNGIYEFGEAEEIWESVQENYKNTRIDEVIELGKSMEETDNDRANMESVIPYLYNQEDLDKYAKEVGFIHGAMAKGGFFDFGFGRPNSAIARDRKYLSQEPHEQAYAPNRKKVPSFYKSHEKGGNAGNFWGVYDDETGKSLFIWANSLEEAERKSQNIDFNKHEGEYIRDASWQKEKMAKGGKMDDARLFRLGITDKYYADIIKSAEEFDGEFGYHSKYKGMVSNNGDIATGGFQVDAPIILFIYKDKQGLEYASEEEPKSSIGSMATGGLLEQLNKGEKIYVLLDVSGSMVANEWLNHFISEIKQFDGEVWLVDTGVSHTFKIDDFSMDKIRIIGGGGTDFDEAFKMLDNKKKAGEKFTTILFTDAMVIWNMNLLPENIIIVTDNKQYLPQLDPNKNQRSIIIGSEMAKGGLTPKQERELMISNITMAYPQFNKKEVSSWDDEKLAMWNNKANRVGQKILKGMNFANGGMTDEKKKIEDKIKIIKASLLSPATPELIKEQYRTKLAQLEKQLADLGRPEPVKEEEVQVVAEEPIVEEKPIEEAKPIAEVITEAITEEVKKQDDVALPEEKAEEGTKKLVKAHIEGTFEGTIDIGGKSARNITVPGNKTYYIDIEPGYRNLIRNTLDYNDIDYTSKTMEDKTYKVFVSTPELLERIFKIYNMKRAHKKDAIIEDISTITGKFKKGGKVWIAKADKKEKTLRNKAIRMGLIKGENDKLTEKDLNKIAKQSKGWKKRVEIIRAVNQVKRKK